MPQCSECENPVQPPYKKVCSAECSKARKAAVLKGWKKVNPEKVKASDQRKRETHAQKISDRQKSWYKANSEAVKRRVHDHKKLQLKTNIQLKISEALRRRLYMAMKRNSKSGSAVRDLGCTIDELKLHLERQFDARMHWGNCGEYWHIDHITPLASFDLTDREQFLRAVHWTNLQPLEKIENIKKGARLPLAA